MAVDEKNNKRTCIWTPICQRIPWTVWSCFIIIIFFFFSSHPLKGGTGCHGHHLHKDNKGTYTALIPSLCTFPLLKTVRNFHLGPESADNARFLSADGLFERFWRPCMRPILLTVVVSRSAWERHHASFTVNRWGKFQRHWWLMEISLEFSHGGLYVQSPNLITMWRFRTDSLNSVLLCKKD